jgi:hypothetical protein
MLFSYFQLIWLQVSTSMTDLCFDVFGIAKEKKDPKSIKGNRGIYTLCWSIPSIIELLIHSEKYMLQIKLCVANSPLNSLSFVVVAELLDVLPSKRKHEDGGDSSASDESSDNDQDELDVCTWLLLIAYGLLISLHLAASKKYLSRHWSLICIIYTDMLYLTKHDFIFNM